MYDEIIARHKPRGWKIIYTRNKTKALEEAETFWNDCRRKYNTGRERASGSAHAIPKCIYCPKITCPAGLFVLLHEFAHVHLKHWSTGAECLHKEEFKAEKWATHIMRAEGIQIPAWVIKWGKAYVRRCIASDSMKGLKIHPPARRFVR